MSVSKSTKAAAGHYQALMKGRLIFDSHGYVKRMTSGGFNEQQAEALAAEQAELLSNLATRQDMDGLRNDFDGLRNDFDGMRKDMANMATKDMLDEIKKEMANMATKDMLEELKRDMANMATKQDLALIRMEIEASAATLRADMKQDKVEMIKWMTGYFLSGLAVMAAALTAMTAVLKLT